MKDLNDPFPPEGLPLDEARQRVLAAVAACAPGTTEPTASERLPLASALGRVCAETLLAPAAVPGFRAAILDGYAIPDAVAPIEGASWRVVGRSAPGAPHPHTLATGEAVRILTGAPLPEGAHRVLAQEGVECRGDLVHLTRAIGTNPWVRAADEEARAGDPLLQPGERFSVATLGRLAGCGVARVRVRRRPRLGLLITGDELVPPGEPRGDGQIWESNSALLTALLERLGYGIADRRVVSDQPEPLRQALITLARTCDVVVSTGGVSAGDTDWIRPLVAELGTVQFWKLFLKPGRPLAFGELLGRPFFGLPGNPVAAVITALQLLWPALQCWEGAPVEPLPRLQVRLESALRRGAGRPELARARLVTAADGLLSARLEGSQASSRIGSLLGADLLLEIPADLGDVPAGTLLWAQLLRLPLF
ncbi:MAG: molybdopterin molybdotransferase MoeA [Cyanobacteriota bacterium]